MSEHAAAHSTRELMGVGAGGTFDHLRHTTATLLKQLGVPARDAQLILGHSRLAITLEVYSHEDRQGQRDALGKISEALGGRH